MGDLGKKAMSLNIFDPMMHHYGQGAFDSSRKGKRGKFKGTVHNKAARKDLAAREAAKTESVLNSAVSYT